MFYANFLIPVRQSRHMLPGVQDMADDFIDSQPMLHLRKDERTGATHFFRVTFHHRQIGANGFGQVGFVDYQQIGLRNARPAFARYLVAARNIDHLDGEISQLPAEARREIVAAGFDEKNLRFEFGVQFFQGHQV